MKRGIFFNLAIIFFLVTLILLPLIVFWITDLFAVANGCDLSIGTTEGYCGSLYTAAFIAGLLGSVTTPILVVVLGVYLIAVLLYVVWQWNKSRTTSQPFPATARGLLISTAALGSLALMSGLVILLINWYQVSFRSDCKGLPAEKIVSDRHNGPLTISVKLPEPQGMAQQYRIIQTPDQEGQFNMPSDLPGRSDPAWSPDGKSLVVVSRPDAKTGWELQLFNIQEKSQKTLLASDLVLASPAWSPDGKSLYYQSWLENSPNPDIEIFIIDIQTGISTRIPGSEVLDGDPRPSPDGSLVVFVSERDQSSDIYIMDRDGGSVSRLTRHPGVDINPHWSPDGQWIVFSSNRGSPAGKNNYNLYIMKPDGSSQCQLTSSEGSEWEPVWSPDGQWIAFISLLESKIFRIRPDGSELTPIDLGVEGADTLSLDWASLP